VIFIERHVSNLSAISWREQFISYIMAWTIYQLYHGVNNFIFRLDGIQFLLDQHV